MRWLLAFLISTTPALAKKGDWGNVDPKVKMWFENATSPKGFLCCSERDGTSTDWEIKPDGFYIPAPWLDGQWIRVPDEAVVLGNPTATAIVWYYTNGTGVRCFAPGPGN
jgi:hypothetical protein